MNDCTLDALLPIENCLLACPVVPSTPRQCNVIRPDTLSSIALPDRPVMIVSDTWFVSPARVVVPDARVPTVRSYATGGSF